MPTLTRKRVNDRPLTWHVHYASVRVGVIVERSGAPPSSDQWQWCCGFYPGSDPGDDRHGTAADFEAARADLFAMAASLLHVWSGEAPRGQPTDAAMLLAAGEDGLEAWAERAVQGLAPEVARTLVTRCSFDAKDRVA